MELGMEIIDDYQHNFNNIKNNIIIITTKLVCANCYYSNNIMHFNLAITE